MKRVPRNWIVCHDGSKKPFGLECLRCGAFDGMTLPIAVTDCVARIKAFEREHGKCEEREPQQ